MKDVVILLGAEIELQEAYNRALPHGTADLLAEEVILAFEQLSGFPFSGPKFVDQIRRLVFRDYPYALFYTVEGGRVFIYAFLDTRQHPEAIRRRLGI